MRLQFLEDGDLTHGSGGDSLVLVLEFDLLECHQLVCNCILGPEDHAVRAFSQPLHLLIPVLEFLDHLTC